jgi:phage terminase small subunit
MSDKLTIKQEKYAQGLFAGLSKREAYKQAYDAENMSDECIDVEACILAANHNVTIRIDELTNELKERNMVKVEKVLAEMAHIAFDDIKNYLRFYPDADGNIKMEIKDSDNIDTRSVSEVSIGKDGQFRFKLYCKDDMVVKLGQHLGMFVEKVEAKNINYNYDSMTTEQLKEKYKEELRKKGMPEKMIEDNTRYMFED